MPYFGGIFSGDLVWMRICFFLVKYRTPSLFKGTRLNKSNNTEETRLAYSRGKKPKEATALDGLRIVPLLF